MKMKSVSSLFCAVAIFGTASVAMAGAYGEPEQAEEMPYSAPVVEEVAPMEGFAPFFYVAGAGLYGEEFFDNSADQRHNSYGWGYNLRAGYRAHEVVGIEMLFEHMVEFDADAATDRDTWTLMPNLKIFLVEGFCEPYLSVGGGLISASKGGGARTDGKVASVEDGYGFAGRFGGGMDIYATENIFMELEVAYILPTSDAANYDHLSVGFGIGYAFN